MTEEPETVAVVTEMNISEDRRETGIKWKKFEVEEGDELIRRQDAEEYYTKKERQRIIELIEKLRDDDMSHEFDRGYNYALKTLGQKLKGENDA